MLLDDDTHATDSTGKAHAEFLKTNLPGDNDGNLQLVHWLMTMKK
jgi:hypothetical protein